MKIAILASLFFITALLYASVGFGGGSTYTALLVIADTDYRLIPVIALTCNILVVTGNVWRYNRQRLLDVSQIWPLIVLSVPAAWLGGRFNISEFVFIGLLWIALLIAGLRLLLQRAERQDRPPRPGTSRLAHAVIGGGIGFYAGLVGIGGGIFLAPILHFMRWGTAQQIAATCSLFILVNSVSGLGGQLTKLEAYGNLGAAIVYWPVIPAVLIGGYIGNHWGVFKLSETVLKRATGALILLVAVRLAIRWFRMALG